MMKLRAGWVGLLAVGAIVALGQSQSAVSTFRVSQPKLYNGVLRVPANLGPSPVQRFATNAIRTVGRADLANFAEESTPDPKDTYRPNRPLTYDSNFQVGVNRADLVSGMFLIYWDGGGAHPNTLIGTHTFAMKGGKPARVMFADLFTPADGSTGFLKRVILPALNQMKRRKQIDPVDSIDAPLVEKFVVTPAGVTWTFAPYDVGAYVEGGYDVKLPWSALRADLRPGGVLSQLAGGATEPPVANVKDIRVTGDLYYVERIAIPQNPKFVFRVVRTVEGSPEATILTKELPTPSGMGKVDVLIGRIPANTTGLELRIEVEAGGRVWFRNSSPILITPGETRDLGRYRLVRANG